MSSLDCPCQDLEGISAWACTGTPADCVMLGLHHVWKDEWPDIVISGINDGPNVAQDTAYSGTIGGAMEGAINGVPSLAVSLGHKAQMSFDNAAQVVERLLTQLLYDKLPSESWRFALSDIQLEHAWPRPGREPLCETDRFPAPEQRWPQLAMPTPCFNVNIPVIPLADVCGIAWTKCGFRKYTDIVEKCTDPRGQEYYWVAGTRVHEEDVPGTDTHALAQGYISVTPLSYNQTSAADLPVLNRMLERG